MMVHVYPGGQNGGSGSPPPARTGVEPHAANKDVVRTIRTRVFFIGVAPSCLNCAASAPGCQQREQKDSPLAVLNGTVLTGNGLQVTGYREVSASLERRQSTSC